MNKQGKKIKRWVKEEEKVEKWFKVGKGLYAAIIGKGANRTIELFAGATYTDWDAPPPRSLQRRVKVGMPASKLDTPIWCGMTMKAFRKIEKELR
jgi:hypothetical protein